MICHANSEIFPKWKEDKDACSVDYCMKIMQAAKEESCGKCILCREGSWQVYKIIKDITEGNAESEDYELLMDLLEQIKKHSSCDMSRTAAFICMDMMKRYENEWDQHIRRKLCSNLVCKGTFTLYIDPNLCDGCGKCLEGCGQGAIKGGDKMIHIINTDRCKKSMECISVCPKEAIKKAGSIKPKTPMELIPVGSFGRPSDKVEGGGRRRRRRRE